MMISFLLIEFLYLIFRDTLGLFFYKIFQYWLIAISVAILL